MKPPIRHLAAFKENANVLGLAALASVSAATLNPLPLLAGAVLEVAYLLFVPDSKWYAAKLAARAEADRDKQRRERRDKLLPGLRPDMQARYSRLEEKRRQLEAPPGSEQLWFDEVLDKLDYLLEKFLFFASSEVRFREHLLVIREDLIRAALPGGPGAPNGPSSGRQPNRAAAATPSLRETIADIEQRYDRETVQIERELQDELDDDTQAVLVKRLEVLKRRREFVAKIGQILVNLRHQLDLVEDTFGLISDELRARSPEQILADIDDVVGQTETMTKVLEDVAPYEQLVARLRQASV
jgi:hypothetical protein